MSMRDSEKLAQFVRSLLDFVIYETIDGNYNHMGATVADAVLQARNDYARNVKPRVNRIMAEYPEARTTAAVLATLETTIATVFLNWRGQDRAERFHRILDLFAAEGIQTEADLRAWLLERASLRKLRSIYGIGPKTVDYFQILVGLPNTAIDRHLRNFLRLAGLPSGSYDHDQAVINGAADILGINRAHFDHSIWQYMSKRAVPSATTECRYERRSMRSDTYGL